MQQMGALAMQAVLTRLKDQGPRALRVALLAFAAGVLLYLGRPGTVGGLPAPVFAGLLYAGLITPAAVLTAAFLPTLTALSDAVQLARLGFAMTVALAPGIMRPLADQPMINATVVILGGLAIVRVQAVRARPQRLMQAT